MTMAYFEKRQMEWINSPNNYILKKQGKQKHQDTL